MTYHIYHLVDPHDNTVRYVGCCSDPKARLRNHCNESKRRQTTKKTRWIHALMAENTLPALVIVATYTDALASKTAEHNEILRHKATIFNIHDPLKFPSIIAKKGKK